jgi:hypothetical protein
MRTDRLRRIAIAAGFFLTLAATAASAGQVDLAWDSVSGATGYRVYYGTTPGQYTGTRDMGNATSGTVTGLGDCTTLYLAVKAYNNAGGISSDFSNEVTGWARPQVESLGSTEVEQGDQVTLNIDGANFAQGADIAVAIDNVPQNEAGEDLLRLDNVSVISCNRIQALVTVEPTTRGLRAMEIGDFTLNLDVVNPDQVFGAGTETLEVLFNEVRTDINRDDASTRDRVDGKDLVWLAHAFVSRDGDADYNPDADHDGNGIVDGEDLSMLGASFGQCWTGSAWNNSVCN